MYLVIGCDDFGFQIFEALKSRGMEVVVVDADKSRIDHMRNLGYKESEAVAGDPSSPEILKRAGFERAEAVLVILPDHDGAEKVVQTVNELKARVRTDPVIVVRVSDDAYAEDYRKMGASDVLPVNQLFADSAISRFEEIKLMINERRLRRFFESEKLSVGKLAIVLQTNPDPDSIASGVALKLYAKAFGRDADLIYDGIIGHPQNRALVNLFNLELHESKDVNLNTSYKWFALVDVSSSAYCALPPTITPTIVLDHHSVPASEVKGRIVDIIHVAAASTILTNYLKFAKIEIDDKTATALLLGLFTDTLNLIGRGFTPLDLQAFQYLWEIADRDLLRRLLSPSVPHESLDVLARAVKSAKVHEGYLFANVGEVKDRDMIADTADNLLRREGVTTTFVYGTVGNDLYVSARTKDMSMHVGKTLKAAVEFFKDSGGTAGGHATMAGATIPVSAFRTSKGGLKTAADKLLKTKFLEAAGVLKPRKPRKPRKK